MTMAAAVVSLAPARVCDPDGLELPFRKPDSWARHRRARDDLVGVGARLWTGYASMAFILASFVPSGHPDVVRLGIDLFRFISHHVKLALSADGIGCIHVVDFDLAIMT